MTRWVWLRSFPRSRGRRSRRRALVVAVVQLIAALAMVLLVLPPASGPASAQAPFWISMFDGRPASPQPYNPPTWDVLVHSRNVDTWKQLEAMQAHHGPDCAGHPASHPISRYEQAVFQCNDHVMTAIQAEGYGLIVLTPNQLVDFAGPAGTEAVVRFDMSTLRSSSRDWVSIWLSPWEDHLPLPLNDWLPDLTGEPRRGIHLMMDNSNGGTMFRVLTIRDFRATEVTTDPNLAYEQLLTPSAVRRDVFELRISRTSLKFGMPAYNRWWVDRAIPDLGWDRGVLQIAHHSYTPWKGCSTPGCGANTWHWDNVSISRPVPFSMQKGSQPWVDETVSRTVTFQGAAPSNAFLRFVGIGSGLQVSFNGGASWQDAQLHAVEIAPEDHFKPYWMPVPPGTSRVDFRGQGWYGGGWMVRDPAIWAQIPQLPLPSSDCSVRPKTTIRTQPLGGGRLQVTAEVGRPPTAASNIVRGVRIVSAAHARVQILEQTIGSGGGSVTPTSASQSVSFMVERQPPTAQVPVTVPFVVTDDCGEWQTFVGGGPTAF